MDDFILDENCFVGSINGTQAQTKSEALFQIAKVLFFPRHFGNNLDALEDCLNDLSWIDKETVVLSINHFDSFLNKESEQLKLAMLDIFKDAEKEKEFDSVNVRKFVFLHSS